MRTAGVEVKTGKHLAFKISEGKRFTRCASLSEDYTEDAIWERLEGKRKVKQRHSQQGFSVADEKRPRSLIDIQSKLAKANSPGFERWAKSYNLKEIAQTVLWMKKHGITNVEKLAVECDAAVEHYFDSLGLEKLPSIKALKQEYTALNAENKKLYPNQKAARKEMIDLLTAKSNLERFLKIKIEQPDRKEPQQEGSR